MLLSETKSFSARKHAEHAEARQRAAFFLVTGIDLDEALAAPRERRAAVISKLGRLVERERIKGARGHWSYDLNRHIALSQALLRLRASDRAGEPQQADTASGRSGVGTKRKRRPRAPQPVTRKYTREVF